MTNEQKIALLQKWQANYQQLDQAMESLRAVVGTEPESQLHRAVWFMFSDYTHVLESHLDDENEWLTWYCYDNEMGKRELQAGYYDNLRPIRSLEDLVELINKDADKK